MGKLSVGSSQDFGNPGDKLTVSVDGTAITAIAATPINTSTVLVATADMGQPYVFANPSTVVISDRSITRIRHNKKKKPVELEYPFKVLAKGSIISVQGFDDDTTVTTTGELIGLNNTGDGYTAIVKIGDGYLFDIDGTQTILSLTVGDFNDGVIPLFYWKGSDLLISEAKDIADPRFDVSNTDISDNQFALLPPYNLAYYSFDPYYDYSNSTTWTFNCTSSASIEIGLGNKSFSYTSTPNTLNQGMTIKIESSSGIYMIGTVTGASSSFAFVTVTEISGSGTYTTWSIYRESLAVGTNRDSSQRAYSCTLNEVFLELFYLLPYRQNNLPEKHSTSTHWINLDIPLNYWGLSEDFSLDQAIQWSSSLVGTAESTLDVVASNTRLSTVTIGSYTYLPTGQTITTYIDRTTNQDFLKTVTRQDSTSFPYSVNLIQITGLIATSGTVDVSSNIVMSKRSMNTSEGSHTPSSGSGSTMPVYSSTYTSWAESLLITNGMSSLSLSDCFLDITGYSLPVTYTSNTTINNNSSSEGRLRNINIDQTFVNNKTYHIPVVILKGDDCVLAKHISFDITFNNTINTTDWNGSYDDNLNFSYTRIKEHNSPPSKFYKLTLLNGTEFVFNKVGSNFIVGTDEGNLASITGGSTSILLLPSISEIGGTWVFDYRVTAYPRITTLNLDTPTYFVVQTLGGTVYDFVTIPISDTVISPRLFRSPSVGTTIVALHCFNPKLDIADYVSELYFKVSSLPSNEAPFGTSLTTHPHTRASYGGRTIATHRPAYPDNVRAFSNPDPDVTLDGLPMIYSVTINNTEYNGVELNKLRGVESTNVEVYFIDNGATKRYQGVTSNYNWVEKEDYCDVYDHLWFCNQKEVELQSVDLAIDYETETLVDFYCWANVYTSAAIIVSEGDHTTGVLKYIEDNKKQVNLYTVGDTFRVAISKKLTADNLDGEDEWFADIYEFNTTAKRFERIGNESGALSKILGSEYVFVSYYPA